VFARVVFALVLLAGTAQSAFAEALDLLGGHDPGTAGLNAMATALDGVAYLGSWGGPNQCPSLGVRLIDIHDPTSPIPITTAAGYQGTTAEHVAVAHLSGTTVLFAGIQRCQGGSGAPGGLALWDVTDPNNPRELSLFQTGGRALGVHEFTVRQQGDRWLVYLAVPNSELLDRGGDLRILDVTDPLNPVQIASWGASKDAGLPIGVDERCAPICRGDSKDAYLHSVALSPDGRTAYLSYWDLGVLILDVSEPRAPRLLGRFAEPLADEGNTHSVALTPDSKLMLVADETFRAPWGGLRLVDVEDPSNPVQLGTYQTLNAASGAPGGAYAHSIHNPLPDDRNGNHAYLAWYGDGVRLLDISDASRPVEIASWVPPQGGQIWNVAFDGDLLVAGDINNGLYMLRR
jgi:hypothetical protein